MDPSSPLGPPTPTPAPAPAPRIASLKPRPLPSLNIFTPPPAQPSLVPLPAFNSLGYDQSPKPVEITAAPKPTPPQPTACGGGEEYYERTVKAIALAMPSAAPRSSCAAAASVLPSAASALPSAAARPVITPSMPAPSLYATHYSTLTTKTSLPNSHHHKPTTHQIYSPSAQLPRHTSACLGPAPASSICGRFLVRACGACCVVATRCQSILQYQVLNNYMGFMVQITQLIFLLSFSFLRPSRFFLPLHVPPPLPLSCS